jgi:acyl carrier protein
MLDGEIVIVDPDTCQPCDPEEIGEIWYRGQSVASHGYWNQPEESQAVFAATLAGNGNASYLRTGDMGFLADGQLYVTGRLKEMLVIRGRNLYPQDLEATAQDSDDAFAEAGAAFSVDIDGAEQLVLVQELDRRSRGADADKLVGRVRAALAETHDIRPAAVVLVRPFSLPRTTSGKMQRLLCRQMYLRDQLNVVAKWEATAPPQSAAAAKEASGVATDPAGANGLPAASDTLSAGDVPAGDVSGGDGAKFAAPPGAFAEGPPNHVVEELEQWLCQRVAVYGNVAAEEVTPDQPLAELGLDSLSAVRLVAEIEDRQQITLNPIAMWNYPTARHLARYLAEQSVGDFAPGLPAEAEANGHDGFADLLGEVEALNDAQVQQRLTEIALQQGPAARYTPRRSVR